MDWSDMKPRERSLIHRLTEAMIHVQTLPELVRCTDEFVSNLISADCMALCTSRPDQPHQYNWLVERIPTAFFDRSEEWSKHDFLRDGVALKPMTAMRDTDLISSKDLKSNPMYLISREEGTPLEHAISIFLPDPGGEGHSGFTAYRSSPRDFSERDRELVQYVSTLLVGTIHKCRLFMERELQARLLDAENPNRAYLVLTPSAELVRRSEGVSALVRKWFPTDERGSSGLPRVLLTKLSALANGTGAESRTWERAGKEESLKVTYSPVPGNGPVYWQLRFAETPRSPLVTCAEPLTEKEEEVTRFLLQGLSDKEIAPRAGCEPSTVKVHVKSIYRKTRIRGRIRLLAEALRKAQEGGKDSIR